MNLSTFDLLDDIGLPVAVSAPDMYTDIAGRSLTLPEILTITKRERRAFPIDEARRAITDSAGALTWDTATSQNATLTRAIPGKVHRPL